MRTRRLKECGAVILAMALLCGTMGAQKTYAADPVNTNKEDCSVEVSLSYNDVDKTFDDLTETEEDIAVHLYKVAGINKDGSYSTSFDDLKEALDAVNDQTTAAQWSAMAQTAKDIVADGGLQPTASGTVGNAITGLPTGLYLVMADQALTDTHVYNFNPYLISLPNNNYYSTQDDSWIYNLTGDDAIGLKPEQDVRYGDLIIEKELTSYDATMGGASFVFQVEGTKDGEVVYSDVHSLAFDGPGKKQIHITGILAGTEVTVTEIYSGAAYTGDKGPFKATIVASDYESTRTQAKVQFKNRFDGRFNGGTSVVNKFSHDKAWQWTQRKDSSAESDKVER